MANVLNKGYTMVMRRGTPKMTSVELTYTLIGDGYDIVELPGKALASKIASKEMIVHNMGIDAEKGLVTTNGALNNYTLINVTTNMVEGQPHAVILNRIEVNDKLVGYTIFNTAGILQEVKVEDAVKIDAVAGISNGKVRHTQDGDIISAIGGTYPLRVLDFSANKQANVEINTGIVFIGSAIGSDNKLAKYAGVLLSSPSAAAITKIYPQLCENNKKVIAAVQKMAGDSKLKSLEIIRTGNAGFYGVFTIDKVLELIAKYNFKWPAGNITVACIDYSADETESKVEITSDLKVVEFVSGTDKANKALKVFVEETIQKLRELKK